MAKILLLSDLHAHNYKDFATIVDGQNSRLLDVGNACLQAFQIGNKLGCKHLIICGDIFQTRGNIKPSVLNYMIEVVKTAVDKFGFEVAIISGNHDLETYSFSKSSAIFALGELDNVSVYTEPTIADFGGLKCGFIPYIHEIKEFKKVCNEIKKGADILAIHQGIDDLKFGGIPDTTIDIKFLTKDFNGWVFSGHYHNPMSKGKVVQVGAPIQHTFGDKGVDRGCWVVDINNDLDGEAQFYKLDYPEFISVDVNGIKKTNVEGKIIELILSDKDIGKAEKLKKAILDGGAIGCRTKVVRMNTTVQNKGVELDTIEEMIKAYIKTIPELHANKEKIMKRFEELKNANN
jgi:DNA repair exonuclease SbcCD nuclease subunit